MKQKQKVSTFIFFFVLIVTCLMMATFSRSMDLRSQAVEFVPRSGDLFLMPTSTPYPTLSPGQDCSITGSGIMSHCSNCPSGFYKTGEWKYKCK